MWTQCKKKLKDMNGCNRVHLNSYIDEYMWRVNNTTSRLDAFEKILRVIGNFFFQKIIHNMKMTQNSILSFIFMKGNIIYPI